jgi:hypothetical protein
MLRVNKCAAQEIVPFLIGQDWIRLRARTSRSDLDRSSFAGHPWVVPRCDMVWSAIFDSASFVLYVNSVKGVNIL